MIRIHQLVSLIPRIHVCNLFHLLANSVKNNFQQESVPHFYFRILGIFCNQLEMLDIMRNTIYRRSLWGPEHNANCHKVRSLCGPGHNANYPYTSVLCVLPATHMSLIPAGTWKTIRRFRGCGLVWSVIWWRQWCGRLSAFRLLD